MIRLVSSLLLLVAVAAAADRPTFDWTRYFDQDQVTAALQQLHEAYPDLTELESLGKSAEGRDIWQLTITGKQAGDHRTKPAMYVDGAIHGNEIQATEVCLYLAWILCDRYGEWDRITELLDRATFYVVPTVNVDSRAHWFAGPTSHDVGRTAREPQDDDHDGLIDEDPPEDLDGDGLILQMRVRDPHGTHRTHPDDPRVVMRVKPRRAGRVDPAGPRGHRQRRRRPRQRGRPRLRRHEPQLRLQLAAALRAGRLGRLPPAGGQHPRGGRLPGPARQRGLRLRLPQLRRHVAARPSSESAPPVDPADIAVYDWLGEHGERTVPGYRYLIAHEDLYTTYGDFDEFAYQVFGILAYTGEITMASEFAYRGRSDQPNGDDGNLWSRRPRLTEKQEFNDHLMAGELFQEWRPFDHPQYGPIEIGGWKPHAVRSTPGWMLPETLHRNAMFVVWTAMQLPRRVGGRALTVEKLGDLYLTARPGRVRARVREREPARPGAHAVGQRTGAASWVRRDLFTWTARAPRCCPAAWWWRGPPPLLAGHRGGGGRRTRGIIRRRATAAGAPGHLGLWTPAPPWGGARARPPSGLDPCGLARARCHRPAGLRHRGAGRGTNGRRRAGRPRPGPRLAVPQVRGGGRHGGVRVPRLPAAAPGGLAGLGARLAAGLGHHGPVAPGPPPGRHATWAGGGAAPVGLPSPLFLGG